jgi:hypothetical protein
VLTRLKSQFLKTATPHKSFSIFSANSTTTGQFGKLMVPGLFNQTTHAKSQREVTWPKDLEYYNKLSSQHNQHKKNILALFKKIHADKKRSPQPNDNERKLVQSDIDAMAVLRKTMQAIAYRIQLQGRNIVQLSNGDYTTTKNNAITLRLPRL